MKTLIEYIPQELRIVTIEDTAEVKFRKHKNYVHLYYDAAANKDSIRLLSKLRFQIKI